MQAVMRLVQIMPQRGKGNGSFRRQEFRRNENRWRCATLKFDTDPLGLHAFSKS